MTLPLLLNEKLIRKNIQDPFIARTLPIEILPHVDSTHQALRKIILGKEIVLPRVLLTEHQTGGIGQLQKKWYGPFAENIYFSFGYVFSKVLSQIEGLSLVIGLSVASTLIKYGVPDVKVKWPNDIYCQDTKILGILVSTEMAQDEKISAIISFGLNVNMVDDGGMIDQPWTSLCLVLGQEQDRNKITGLLISELLASLTAFENHGFAYFLPEWQMCDWLFGKSITLQSGESTYEGIASGINARGHLLLQNHQGKIIAFASGNIVKNQSPQIISPSHNASKKYF